MIGGVVQATCRNRGEDLLQVDGWMRQDLVAGNFDLCAERLAWSAELVADT